MTDPLEVLPPELVETVFSDLTLTDLLSCSLVSRLWNTATENEILWKNLCISRGWKRCYEFDKCIFDCFKSFNDEEMQRICSFNKWKEYFVLRNLVKYNWNYGNFRESEVFVTEEAQRITCVSRTNRLLAIGCSKGIVQVFNVRAEHKLIQTIKFKKPRYIGAVMLSSEYLPFCQRYRLFVFKVNEEGTFDFCSIKEIGETEALSISDPSDFIGDHYLDDDDDDEEEEEDDDDYKFVDSYTLGVKFCMNDDFLVANNPLSHAIFVWNLKITTNDPVVSRFEHEKGTILTCIDLMDDVVTATFSYEDLSFISTGNHYRWFMTAFSLKDEIQLYRSATICEPNLSLVKGLSLHRSISYTLHSVIRSTEYNIFNEIQNKVYLFNNCGTLIYEAFTDFIDIAAYPDDNDFIAIEKNDSLLTYNPKTGIATISIDMLQGMILGICNGVLVTECDEFDRFGSSGPKFEFWRLKRSQQSEGPLFTLTTRYEVTTVFSDTSILFVGSRSIFLLDSMV
ncbi:hypothetical protein LSTR_LSTR012894 [Laodelphax striatellus]|uniref:F-box domain-containing protein n=1 Tax=Laodelphax striatellus TaxID=195883 RepID=A0A482WMY8_LAOST|nr:hypothetical protein LSTR_LSTR012894 [Laodelphax striatellus]